MPQSCPKIARGEGAARDHIWLAVFGCGLAAAEDRPAAASAPAGLAGAAIVPGGRRPRFQLRRRHQRAVRLPQAARDHRRHRADAAPDRPRRLRRRRHGAAQRGAARRSRTRIEIKPAPVLRCEMAESLAAWIQRRGGAAARQSRHGLAQRRDLRRLRMPRPQPRQRRQAQRARQGQCRRRARLHARRRPRDRSDRHDSAQGFARGSARERLPPFHHGARTRLRRPSRGPYPSRSRRAPAGLSHLPVGRARAAGRSRQRANRRQIGAAADAAAGRGRRVR